MIEVNGHAIMADVNDILLELRKELELNGIKRFQKIVPSGRNLQTNCPFHKDGQEKKPSFGINTDTGECHCFGCGWQGNLPEMISNCFGKDDFGLFGSKWLVKNFISAAIESRQALDLSFSRSKTIESKKYVEEAELDSYRYTHPYMYKRKLTDEIIELFDIGYDKEKECITFPVKDENGNCLFVARRSVKTKFFNYPSGSEKPVYGLYELHHYFMSDAVPIFAYNNFPKDIIICESMIDALTCWVYGKYAVALNGLGNELQFEQLRKLPCRKFILATDMDEAGLRARKRIKEALKNKLVTEYIWDFSIAKDINDMTKDYFESLQEVF